MLKYIISLLLVVAASYAEVPESRKIIAVLDIGVEPAHLKNKNALCRHGHKSFIDNNPLADASSNMHGTNIVSIIERGLDTNKYCILMIKADYLEELNDPESYVKSLEYAVKIKPAYVNMSIQGIGRIYKEKELLEKLLQQGAKISVSAGNDKKDLGARCDVYPACYSKEFEKYKRFYVVGSMTYQRANYGPQVTRLEDGVRQGYNHLSGTSQAAALFTSRMVMSND